MNRARSIFTLIFFVSISLIVYSCGGDDVVEEIIRPVRYVDVFSTGGNRVSRKVSGIAITGACG